MVARPLFASATSLVMQRPTCTDIRIRSTRDAHIIFHAVSLNILPIISRRLDADERAALRSGCVYAWEERGPHTEVTGLGIERFTEGRRWGPSRVRDEFLFYYEKSPPGHLREKENPHEGRVHKQWDPLVKQTYSVWVDGPKGRRKWHLTAYFTQATVDRLQTVDDKPQLAGLEVPLGKYISTRQGKPRRQDDSILAGCSTDKAEPLTHGIFRPTNMPAPRTYAPFPMPHQVTPPAQPTPQQVYNPHQQAYGHPYYANSYEHPDQSSRPFEATPESHVYYYYPTGPPAIMTRPGVDSQRPPQGYNSPASYQQHCAPSQYTYAPPPGSSNANVQLATPTTSSQPSPAYSPHEYSGQNDYYAGQLPLPYGMPPPAGPATFSQRYQIDPSSHSDRLKRPPPICTSSQMKSGLPSPESAFSGCVGMSPRRSTLSLPPHIANRLSPPISDARDEHIYASSSTLSPPQSPHSVSSSSGGRQLTLAPLRTLARAQAHPYRRDKFDDKALMALSGRKVSE